MHGLCGICVAFRGAEARTCAGPWSSPCARRPARRPGPLASACQVPRVAAPGILWRGHSGAAAPGKLRRMTPAAPAALGKLGRRLLAVAPAGLGKRLPAALGRRRPGGARSVGRSGRMSERWRCGRAPGSEPHGVMHCCTRRKMKKRIQAHHYRFISIYVDLANVCKPAWWGTDNTGTPGTRH